MRHRYLLFLGFLGIARLAAAQTVVTGVVRDTTGQALPGALLEARPLRDQQSPAAVAVAGADGSYALRVPFTTDSLLLSARALGFAEQELRIRNHSRHADFRLRTSAAQLREVVVKASPLTKHGDTLSYHVAAFATPQDRVIADVLKKLPGVEVEADGRILFEGQPIQKFYINGADLLEGRYNLASNNLPAASVQDVQVLQRHQPVRALAGVQPSEQASLNLQLKKHVTVTGQARVGAGGAPLRWNANVAPMLFAPGHQLLDTYQTNNTGYDAATELRPLGLEDLRQLGELPSRPVTLTGIQRLDAPPLPTGRYLFNQVHLLAANHLLTLSKQSQLRVNASYLHDAQRQSGQTRTLYYLPDQTPVELREDKQNQLSFNTLQTDLALIRNLPRYYFKNTFSFRGTHDAQRGYLGRGALPAVEQRATTPSYALSNRLGLVRPLGNRLLLQFASLLSYSTDPQQLAVQPGPFAILLRPDSLPYDEIRQRARLTGATALHSLTLLAQRGLWSYSLAAGLRQEWQQLTSTLTPLPLAPGPVALHNDLSWYRGKYYLEPGLNYRSARTTLQFAVPLGSWHISAHDAALAIHQRLQPVVAEPSLLLRRELASHWHARASAELSNRFGDVQQLTGAYLLRDYRTLARNAGSLNRSRRWSSTVGMYFEDPITSWFCHLTYSHAQTTNSLLYRQRVLAGGALLTETLPYVSHLRMQAVAGQASKFITTLRTTLTAHVGVSNNQQPQLLNDALVPVRNQTGTATLKAAVAAFGWGTISYSGSLTGLRSRVGPAAAPAPSWLQEHHAGAAFFHRSHQLLLNADYYNSQRARTRVAACFVDATYRYTLPTSRKMDLEISGSNLFNARQYQYAYLSDFTLVQSSYALRPRQVLGTWRVSF